MPAAVLKALAFSLHCFGSQESKRALESQASDTSRAFMRRRWRFKASSSDVKLSVEPIQTQHSNTALWLKYRGSGHLWL